MDLYGEECSTCTNCKESKIFVRYKDCDFCTSINKLICENCCSSYKLCKSCFRNACIKCSNSKVYYKCNKCCKDICLFCINKCSICNVQVCNYCIKEYIENDIWCYDCIVYALEYYKDNVKPMEIPIIKSQKKRKRKLISDFEKKIDKLLNE